MDREIELTDDLNYNQILLKDLISEQPIRLIETTECVTENDQLQIKANIRSKIRLNVMLKSNNVPEDEKPLIERLLDKSWLEKDEIKRIIDMFDRYEWRTLVSR